MPSIHHLTCLLTAAAFLACQEQATQGGEETTPAVTATTETAAEPAPGSLEAKISLAESAGPADVASGAAIVELSAEEGVAPVELRAGTNGWTCFPDDPNIPGKDPMCLDAEWMGFVQAWMDRTEPSVESVGIGYMLQGGRAASATDPYATEPPEGQSWMEDGPHLMVIAPDPAALAAFPTEPSGGGPWVMWSGTPYAHVMVPVTTGGE